MTDTTFLQNTVRDHKKTAIGGGVGVTLTSLLFIGWPYITDIKEANVAQWREIGVLKAQVATLEKEVAVLQAIKQKDKP